LIQDLPVPQKHVQFVKIMYEVMNIDKMKLIPTTAVADKFA